MLTKITHPLVIIMGAGATRGGLEKQTKSLPPPIDLDFFDIAAQLEGHGTKQIASKILKSLWELYGTTSNISLEKYYRDIETRAKIGEFAKTGNQPKDWKKRQRELEELVRRVYIHTTCDMSKSPIAPLESPEHVKIFQNLKASDTIVTFNYDLLIEESLKTLKTWRPIDGFGNVRVHGRRSNWYKHWLEENKKIKAKSSKNKSKSISLLKLHGSLGWTTYNGEIRLKPHPYYVGTRNKQPRSEEISILPPGWNKQIDINPYKKFWHETRLKMEKCKSLMIVGYSLPETDLLAQALFSEIVRMRSVRKQYLKQLHLADPNDAIKQKFANLFAPALGPKGIVFRYSNIQKIAESCSDAAPCSDPA
ncbi:MAG: hypothetical protein A2285_00370 [Elusimicrobia bacterium RIFOXYA12_FULL_57_11]|nr:MAG: hypothetical protein A2285_00370 [Elusimicrobia bacterium RIFOXYA12_FULL_57_11]